MITLTAERIGAFGVSRQHSQYSRSEYSDVTDIARRFSNRGEPLDDLVQVARVGLVNAVNRFDVDTGAEFLSFAVPTMMGQVRRHFRDHSWAVKVPRRLKDLQRQLVQARGELSQRLGRAPTASEIADHLGIDHELVIEAVIAGSSYSTRSTDCRPDRTTNTDRSARPSASSTPIWIR